MFPNLLGQKAYRHLTNTDMARLIGVSRRGYEKKIASGYFTAEECKALCRYFNKPFEYLFATEPFDGVFRSAPR